MCESPFPVTFPVSFPIGNFLENFCVDGAAAFPNGPEASRLRSPSSRRAPDTVATTVERAVLPPPPDWYGCTAEMRRRTE